MFQRRLAAFVLVAGSAAQAQWVNYSPVGTPRTRDGKVNLAAPAPRAPGGKPDLSGVWMHETTTVAEVKRLFGNAFDDDIAANAIGMEVGTQHKYAFNILVDFKPQDSPMRPETKELMEKLKAGYDPAVVCKDPAGMPLAGLLSEPIKIVQGPKETIVFYEVDNLHRQIFTDGRKLPKEFDLPAFMGYSVGHWERDVFVAESAGFNEKTTLDDSGTPHSDALRVTERFHRRDFGHLDIEMTFDDPKMYTRPFTIKIPHYLLPDQDIFEMFCENEKDSAHIKK